jgi:hypothetical protein
MKKYLLFLLLILFSLQTYSQAEVPTDSIHGLSEGNYKEFGNFLLDMNLLRIRTPQLPKPELLPSPTRDYNKLFSLSGDKVYSQGFMPSPFLNGTDFGSRWWGTSSMQPMQTATFKLNNGIRLSTFGDYNMDGYRVNRSPLPWEKNNFRGGFELKSGNFGFGIQVEVRKKPVTPF